MSSSPGWPQPPSGRDEAFYRDLYKDRIDFRMLGREDSALAAVLDARGQMDFQDAAAVKQLTMALLQRDFGLAVDLPDDRLCPPVPGRHSYILWLKALLDSSSGSRLDGETTALTGLDIGTGASCIYPLLGCVQRPRWCFVATDIDARSLGFAQANVTRNGLQGRIRLLPPRQPDDALIPTDGTGHNETPLPPFAFTMTNPPFYASADDMATSVRAKERPPHAVCTGATGEMVTPGGEVAFVSRLLVESVARHEAGRDAPGCWYTAMLGKLSSLAAIVEQLRARQLDNYAVAVFVQGSNSSSSKSKSKSKTRRWAIGWSFGGLRPSVEAARGGASSSSGGSSSSSTDAFRHLLPPMTETTVWSTPCATPSPPTAITRLATYLDSVMRHLELVSWTWDRQHLHGAGRARENVWARSWRRKKLRAQQAMDTEDSHNQTDSERIPALGDCAFGFTLSIQVGVTATAVRCRWTEGHNEVLFQSFEGFLKRKLRERGAAEAMEVSQSI